MEPKVGRSSESGSALVELGIILPLMLGLLFGAADFGRAFFQAMAVTHAATAGVHYGARSVALSKDLTGMQNAATASAADITGFTPTASRSCACWDASSGTETTATCTTTCTSPAVKRIYVSVTASSTFNTLVGYPGLPKSVKITRSARMRAQ